jgi:8-oxo-dGTP pyrophosphatase MutT (NUDIX family)
MHSRESLINSVRQYQTEWPEENLFKAPFLELLQYSRCFHRDHLPGHITGSAWIIDISKQFTLLTHHAKLNKWLQPGGHADGEEDIISVALREANEETGLKSLKVLLPAIFDFDIHVIPARKEFPEHLHFDIRVLLQASKDEQLIITDESHDLKWFQLHDLNELTENNRSIIRMAQKIKDLPADFADLRG